MGDVYEIEIKDESEAITENVIIDDLDERKDLVENLCKEYNQANSDRADKLRTWAKWRRQFEGRPFAARKDYPYPNASNTVPPLSLIVGQALFGHLSEMYDAIEPHWYVKPLREEDKTLIRQTEVLTKYYNMLSDSPTDLNLSKFKREFLQEVAVMGTCYVKVPYSVQPWQFKDREGNTVKATIHDGPELVVVPIEDVVYPEEYTEIQSMPWIAHDVLKAEYELKNLVAQGIYEEDAVEAVLQYVNREGTVKTENEDTIKQSHRDRKGQYVLTEFYAFYDADKDGEYEDLVFTIHVPSGTLLRIDYNTFGYRMMAAGTFVQRSYSLEGRGSGQTTEYHQDEIEGIHNVRNDNMKFANMRVLAVRRGAIKENEGFYPGKLFPVDNPKEDIVPVQLGEVYPSSLQAENMTMNYAREASGMSSIMSGFSDQRLGSRDTARGQSMRLSRGQGLFSSIAKGLNECWAEIGMMIFFQLVENRERVIAKEEKTKRLNEEELGILEDLLSLNVSEVPQKIAFVIRTSDIDQTFEMKRQNMLALTQLFSQYAQQTTELSMMLFGPQGEQMKQLAPDAYAHNLSVYVGATRMMDEIFKFFGKADPQRYVPDIKKQEFLLDMINSMNNQMVDSAKRLQQQGPGGEAPLPEEMTAEETGPEMGSIEGVM